MDRNIVYPGAIPLDTDVLTVQRSTMVGLGYLAQASLGTGTVVDGLACTQTTVASLSFNIGPGSILALSTVDTTAFGSLSSDNTDPLVKMGINIGTTQFTTTAPVTGGQSINYLVQAAFQESDATSVVLPYYNSSNPAVPYSGPANAGTAQNTQRLQRVNLQMKTGTSATTGSQVTPTPDGGFVGLWVVTVAFGQTTVIAGNIAAYSTAPFLNATQGLGLKPGRLINVQRFTSSGTYTATTGTNSIEVEVQGGGGAGGGAAASGAAQTGGGAGGAAGAWGWKRITSAFSGTTVTVGAGGTGVLSSAGNAGSTSSFGAFVSSPGGPGGTSIAPASPPNAPSGGATGGTATGGDVNVQGGHGAPAWFGTNFLGGKGGASHYGEGAFQTSSTSNGTAALSPGAGGSGASLAASSGTAVIGGNGATGIVIIREYS